MSFMSTFWPFYLVFFRTITSVSPSSWDNYDGDYFTWWWFLLFWTWKLRIRFSFIYFIQELFIIWLHSGGVPTLLKRNFTYKQSCPKRQIDEIWVPIWVKSLLSNFYLLCILGRILMGSGIYAKIKTSSSEIIEPNICPFIIYLYISNFSLLFTLRTQW